MTGIGMLPGKTKICLMALKNFNLVVSTFQVEGKHVCTLREERHSCFLVFVLNVRLQSDSENDYPTGCRNVSHCQQQQSYSGLRSPGRSNWAYFWNDWCWRILNQEWTVFLPLAETDTEKGLTTRGGTLVSTTRPDSTKSCIAETIIKFQKCWDRNEASERE